MKVFCAYSKELDRFLKQVVGYVLDKYGDELDISNLQEIELVRQIEDNTESDGRFEGFGTRIVLAERKYLQLPHLDIHRLNESDAFNSVVSTLYHEMGHASDMARMPSLYKAVFEANGNYTPETAAAMLFLEYVANLRSDGLYTGEHEDFCDQVVSGLWNKYAGHPPDLAFYYMAKVSIYFIVRTEINNSRDYYLSKARDSLFAEFIMELDSSLKTTYKKLPFDDLKSCSRVEKVLKKYMPKFERKYSDS